MGIQRDVLIGLVVILILLADVHLKVLGSPCNISLPQKSNQLCVRQRQQGLNISRQFYELTDPGPKSSVPFPLINKSFSKLYQAAMKDPINGLWFSQYYGMANKNRELTLKYLKEYKSDPFDAYKVSQFKEIYDLWVKEGLKSPYTKYPYIDFNTTFQDPFDHWQDDSFFTEQRLAGLNPMSLSRVSSGRWDYFPLGCYEDNKDNRAFDGIYLNLRNKIDWTKWPDMSSTIDKCAEAARKLGYKYFAVQFFGECWGDARTDLETKLGVEPYTASKRCQNGVGKTLSNFVYQIQDSHSPGVLWSDLKRKVNQDYDWEKAIESTLGEPMSMERLIKDGHLFVLQYPLKDNLPTVRDIVEDTHPIRKMRKDSSPIAFFVSKKEKSASERKLVPLAIQVDHKPGSLVYTPEDGTQWKEAKLSIQSSDLLHAQMIEHLLKSHIIFEPMCVVMFRHLSEHHPLHQILQFHCRGVILTNSFGFPVLMADGANMHRLFGIGNKGSMAMLVRGYNKLTWEDLDFETDIKRRGLDDVNALPYYPYRDDGRAIMNILTKYAEEYINLYYDVDQDVLGDTELQGFANELSDTGSPPLGGNGKFKKFPSQISTKAELVNVLSRMIWISSVGHSIANYPVAVYGAMTFNMPTKLYEDVRAYPNEFSIHTLPNIPTSVIQVNLAMGLGSLHYDSLLDYFFFVKDSKAQAVTKKYFGVLRQYVEPILKQRNIRRFKEGRMTYPFMLPSYIGNSIHT